MLLPGSRLALTADTSVDTLDESNVVTISSNIVCIICNRCIIGTEAICKLTKGQILLHKKRLSVETFEEDFETTLKPEVIKQYQINGDDFKGMLLSPQSRKHLDGYATCSFCFSGMQSHMATKRTPPKILIANGFVIGSFPQEIQSTNKDVKELQGR